jgi:hypothetical protein
VCYYTFLGGAHHSHGHNDSWRVLPTWQQALDAPGATQMGVLRAGVGPRYLLLLQRDDCILILVF